MATKVPIYLKRGSRKGKKEKLRDILSSDMISPPLGDFRHTIHIGSGGQGDTFGDISFLQGKFHLLPRSDTGDPAQAAAAPFEFSRAATMSGSEAAAAPSPLLKNAISLPALGGAQALTLPTAPAPPKPPRLHLDEAVASPPCARAANGEAEPLVSHPELMVSHREPLASHREPMASHREPMVSHREPMVSHRDPLVSHPELMASHREPMASHREPMVSHPELMASHRDPLVSHPESPVSHPESPVSHPEPLVSHAGSLLSLHVDLGPSILEDVLQVMERHQAERARPQILT